MPEGRPDGIGDVDVAATGHHEIVEEAAGAGLEGRRRLAWWLEVVHRDRSRRATGDVEAPVPDLHADGAPRPADERRDGVTAERAAVDVPAGRDRDEEGVRAWVEGDALGIARRVRLQRQGPIAAAVLTSPLGRRAGRARCQRHDAGQGEKRPRDRGHGQSLPRVECRPGPMHAQHPGFDSGDRARSEFPKDASGRTVHGDVVRTRETTWRDGAHLTRSEIEPARASSIVTPVRGSRGDARRSRSTTALHPTPTSGATSRGT